MTETAPISTRERTLRDGTILGCLWTLTFTVSTITLRFITTDQTVGFISTFLLLVLTIASPVLAYHLAKKHWSMAKRESATFGNIWIYIITMYLCAILLSALAKYIYLEFCDPSLFQDVISDFSSVRFTGDEEGLITKSVTEQFRLLDEMPTGDLVLSQAVSHLTTDILVTTFLAFIIYRNIKSNIWQ